FKGLVALDGAGGGGGAGGGAGSSYSLTPATFENSQRLGDGLVTIRYTVKAASSTTLTSSPNPSQPGQTVTYLARVSGAGPARPTGAVTFADGGTPIGTVALFPDGVALLTQTYAGAGRHTVTATYAGDRDYEGSASAVLTQTVQ
ncbi:Ig-like domain-containing protein, partial [Streptacidiphilus anmyonensis]|uniref:Ig-like domain-containing protein n=1 Tax=Streptacidiphilus anmyonensis TaxID=405782 RepID=UPI0005A91DAC